MATDSDCKKYLREHYEEMIRRALMNTNYDVMELHHLQSMANCALELSRFNVKRDELLDAYVDAVMNVNIEVQDKFRSV